MRADHRSDGPDDDLVTRDVRLQQVEEFVEVGRVAVQHRQAFDGLAADVVGEGAQ